MDTVVERIIVLGGGSSVKTQDVDVRELKKRAYVIGINDAGLLAPVDCIVSMDRIWMEQRYPSLQELALPTFLRNSAYRKNLKDAHKWPGLQLFECNHNADKFNEDKDHLDGTSSGTAGFNLAYQMRPREIYLFGFDHFPSQDPNWKSPYWYPPYPWDATARAGNSRTKYMNWSKKYAIPAQQLRRAGIVVYNVSPQSHLPHFQKIDYRTFLDLCARLR